MEIRRKKGNKFFITEQSPSFRDFTAKAKRLYRELLVYIKKTPVLNDMYEMNLAKQREKVTNKTK